MALLAAWRARHGTPTRAALHLARCADLVALVELASRAGASPVADRAAGQLRAIARSGDVHAAATHR